MIKTFIKVNTQFNALHRYADAPQEVNFLKNIHRHRFVINCKVQVFHDDREVEFYMLVDSIDEYLHNLKIRDTESCEMIAKNIGEFIILKYGKRLVEIEVAEDGINSAIVEWGS